MSSVTHSPPKSQQPAGGKKFRAHVNQFQATGRMKRKTDDDVHSGSAKSQKPDFGLEVLGEMMMRIEARMQANTETLLEKLKTFDAMKERIDKLEEENERKTEEITELRDFIFKLGNRVEIMDRKQREKNILIYGIPSKKDRELSAKKLVNQFIQETLELSVRAQEARILENPDTDAPPTILVELYSVTDKHTIFKNCNKLAGSSISVQDDLTPLEKKLRKDLVPEMKKLRKEGKKASIHRAELYVDGKRVNKSGTTSNFWKMKTTPTHMAAINQHKQ